MNPRILGIIGGLRLDNRTPLASHDGELQKGRAALPIR